MGDSSSHALLLLLSGVGFSEPPQYSGVPYVALDFAICRRFNAMTANPERPHITTTFYIGPVITDTAACRRPLEIVFLLWKQVKEHCPTVCILHVRMALLEAASAKLSAPLERVALHQAVTPDDTLTAAPFIGVLEASL